MTSLGLKVLSVVGSAIAGAIDVVHAITGKNKKEPVDHTWQKPAPTDRRSPCPMLNALANHGYLPHDGKNVSLARLVTGFREAINLAPDATLLVGIKALQASSTGNFLTINLDDLDKHGIIEHDGSLTRHDFHSGDNHTFSPELFEAFAAHFKSDVITVEAAARARNDRLEVAPQSNPEFQMSASDRRFSAIETASYLLVFGDNTVDGTAKKEWVKTFFQQERLPFDEGFKRPEKRLTVSSLFAMQKKVEEVAV